MKKIMKMNIFSCKLAQKKTVYCILIRCNNSVPPVSGRLFSRRVCFTEHSNMSCCHRDTIGIYADTRRKWKEKSGQGLIRTNFVSLLSEDV